MKKVCFFFVVVVSLWRLYGLYDIIAINTELVDCALP
jgi:hypothetical protein